MRALRVDWLTLFLAALGLLGTALILLREANYGAGTEADSVLYVSVARNLLEGDGFTSYWGNYGNAPPLYPLAIAFTGLFGIDAIDGAGYINATAFGLTIFATAMWLRSRIESRFLVVWAGCACILSPLLARVSAHVLTEPLFILFTVLSLFALCRFLDTRRMSFLLLAAVCAALSCLTRYPGVIIIFIALILLAMNRDTAFPEKIKHSAIYFVIAIGPLGVWMLRNLLISGSLTGRYHPADFSVPFGITIVASALLLLMLRWDVKYPAKIKNAALLVVIVIAPIGVWMLRNFLISGALIGKAYPADFSPLSILHTVSSEFIKWGFGNGGFKALSIGFAKVSGISLGGEPTIAGLALTLAILLVTAIGVAYLLLRLNLGGGGGGGAILGVWPFPPFSR